MKDTPDRVGGALQAPPHQSSREQVLERARRYKRRIAIAALTGFGIVSVAIVHPSLSFTAIAAQTSQTTMSSSSQDTATPTSTSTSYFSQEGSGSNATSTSTHPTATSSSTS